MTDYTYITLNDLVAELSKLQEKHGNDHILSIGSTSGKVKGMASPFALRFEGNVCEYIPAYQRDIHPEHKASEKYRVVLTCWDANSPKPFSDDLSGVTLSLFQTEALAQEAIAMCVQEELVTLNDLESDTPCKKEPVFDSDGCIVGYDYPFRGDLYGDHDGIVRFWDGDDYREVTAYNIHPLACDSEDIDKCSYYKYRGFLVVPNEAHTSFRVEQFGAVLFQFKSLQEALREIDDVMVDLSYGVPTRKPSLVAQIHSASPRSAESQPASKVKAKKLEFEH